MAVRFQPQPGSQMLFASNSADICIYAGQPGSGKSFALCFELLRWIDRPTYGATAYRRLSKQLFDAGGLWSVLEKVGGPLGVTGVRSPLPMFNARTGATISLQHMQNGIKTAEGQDGKGFDLIGFDELTHFDDDTFWYLVLTRLRSSDPATGFKPYARATTMAKADTFVHELVKPWLMKDGWPDYAQSGRIRWFLRHPISGVIVFFSSQEEAAEAVAKFKAADERLRLRAMSLSVVHAVTDENRVLMAGNPDYAENQGNLSRLERLQKQGCWEARPESAGMFDRQWYYVRDDVPKPEEVVWSVRGWDKASTKPSEENVDPDWTVGVRLDLLYNGHVCVSDVVRMRDNPGKVQELIRKTAELDGPLVEQSFWKDPAQAGDQDEYHTRNMLSLVRGCGQVTFTNASKSKTIYAMPASAYADKTREKPTAGFAIVRAHWNAAYFAELEVFPKPKSELGKENKDDQVDAQSAAWQCLEGKLPAQVVGGNDISWLMSRIKM